jgi:hypothetical protein
MFWKRTTDSLVVSHDCKTVALTIGLDTFAHIAYAAAWPGSDLMIVTAARTDRDRADVRANHRGNYRAFRIDAEGAHILTDEYTNTAIPLAHGQGFAYSNGSSLVIVRDGVRRAYKVGRFGWGPVSLSCDSDGDRVAMTKWRGSDRKVAFVDPGMNAALISRFSHYSYLLQHEAVVYVLGKDIMSYSPASGKSHSITPTPVRRQLLEALGIGPMEDGEAEIRFGGLSLFEDQLVTQALVLAPHYKRVVWHGLVGVTHDAQGFRIIHAVDDPWRISYITTTNDTLCLGLELYDDNSRIVNKRVHGIGRHAAAALEGWRPIPTPRVPDHGFQFLP